MSITIEQFVERLTQSGLMSAQEIDAFHKRLPADRQPKDVQQLAQTLVQQQKLTKYQAQAVYQGKTKGLVFGEYVVVDKLGEGGMGVVLKAQHRRMKRFVAVKMISRKAIGSPDAVKRFYREVEAAAKLNHPNIVTAHDAGEHDGIHYLVMEFVEGKDLAAIVRDHGPMAMHAAVECIRQTARGLQYAHDKRIVHRDIKPSNLLMDKEGTIKILDMGLARMAGLAEDSDQDRLTGTGQVMGTCDYMAPEQAMDAHRADTRADIYSLGCTLYRLLTGHVPYKGDTLMQILMSHQQAPIPSLCKECPDVPPQLDAVFRKMVAKAPENRQQTMAEVVTELEAFLSVSIVHSVSAPAVKAESSSAALSKTLAFLQENKPGRTLAAPYKTTAAEQRTEQFIGSEHETTSNSLGKARRVVGKARRVVGKARRVVGKARRVIAKVRRKPLVLMGLAGVLILLLGTVLAITLRHGTLMIEIDEQLGKDVQVTVSQSGGKVQLLDAKAGWTLSLSAGKYDLAVADGDAQFQLDSQNITVTRGGQVIVKVTLKSAVAPFDAKEAQKYQAHWTRQLGVPIEITNSVGMKLVFIPPGEFMMGSPKELIEEELKTPGIDDRIKEHLLKEGPQHRVRITKPFYLGTYEVTQEEYQRVIGGNPSKFQGDLKLPVEQVSWDDAREFCRRLSELPEEKVAKRRYALPTEAQWEYACRAGSTGRWCFSSQRNSLPAGFEEKILREYGWFDGNSDGKTHPVGEKKPNAFGLFDMHGNVQEWCADLTDGAKLGSYAKPPTDDPTGPPTGQGRILRGGCWQPGPVTHSRSAFRNDDVPWAKCFNMGFRVSLVLADETAERAKISHTTDAVEPSAGLTNNTPLPAVDSSVGDDGKQKLPSGPPPPAIAPFDAPKAKEHQDAWAKQLGVPVETTNSIGMKLVLIPPGEFMMGSPKELIDEGLNNGPDHHGLLGKDSLPCEGPQHRVRLTRPFYLGVTHVTQEEYQRVMGTNPSLFSTTGQLQHMVAGQETKRFPVEMVSWSDAVEFCRRLSALPNEMAARRRYGLPTEAQWEYACRAGSTGRFSFSSSRSGISFEQEKRQLSDYGWFNRSNNNSRLTHAVGLKLANAWGLYDMHGNVFDWCQDWYDKDYYVKSPTDDPAGPTEGSARVIRGGSWYFVAWDCRSAQRSSSPPSASNYLTGFRVALVFPDK